MPKQLIIMSYRLNSIIRKKKLYDITPLLKNEMFSPLQNPDFFKNVQVEAGGYAVFWNEEIDISEYELWLHGTSQ